MNPYSKPFDITGNVQDGFVCVVRVHSTGYKTCTLDPGSACWKHEDNNFAVRETQIPPPNRKGFPESTTIPHCLRKPEMKQMD